MNLLYDIVKKDPSLKNYYDGLSSLTRKKRYLLNAFLQLTPECNFSCLMCYARMEHKEIENAGKHVMLFEEWKYYLDSLFDMGVVDIVLTGGECTLHPDFSKIYSYCYDKGATMHVFTNASVITEDILRLFASRPPRCVSVTVYGSSPETYELLCANRSAFKKVYANIDKLAEVAIEVHLKYTTVKENIEDLIEVERYFREKGYILRAIDTLTRYDRSKDSVLEKECVDHDHFERIMHQISSERTGKPIEEVIIQYSDATDYCEVPQVISKHKSGMPCSAGRNSCHIDWEGKMTPCVAFNAFSEDPREIGFKECWQKMVEWCDQVPVLEECVTCPFKFKCNRCIAIHYNDTGEFGKPSPRLCWKRLHPDEANQIIMNRSKRMV